MEDGRWKDYDGKRKKDEVRPQLHSISCIELREFLPTLHNQHICFRIVCRLNIHYDVTDLSNTMTRGLDFVFLLVARNSPSELDISTRSSVGSFKAMKLLLLKSALLIAFVASALTSLTSVTTRENRSEIHSPLAAPEVVGADTRATS